MIITCDVKYTENIFLELKVILSTQKCHWKITNIRKTYPLFDLLGGQKDTIGKHLPYHWSILWIALYPLLMTVTKLMINTLPLSVQSY